MKKILWYITHNKLTFRITLIFSVIGIVSLLLLGNWIINDCRDILYEKNMTIEKEAFNKLSTFTSETYLNMHDLLVVINSSKGISGILNSYSHSSSEVEKNKLTGELLDDMENIVLFNDFLDFIIIDEENNIFYETEKNDRALEPNYSYEMNDLINNVITQDEVISIAYEKSPEYIRSINQGDVVSFVGNIIILERVPEIESIGYYIINISAEKFIASYQMNAYTNDLISKFVIVDEDNQIVFTSDKDFVDNLDKEEQEKIFAKKSGTFEDEIYYWMNDKVSRTDMRVISLIEKDVFEAPIKSKTYKIYLVIIITIVLYIFITLLISQFITNKIYILIDNMKMVMNGNMKVKIPVTGQDEINNIYRMFNVMCQRLDEDIERLYIAELKRKDAELAALQSQINPHYLYNTLETIRSRATIDNNYEVERMVYLLGEIFRWNSRANEFIVGIDEEMEIITQYLELQSLKFEDKFEVNIDVDDDVLDMCIPKMIIQPIVENNIGHGIDNEKDTNIISITARRSGERIEIVIVDNGLGMDPDRYEEVIKTLNKRDIENDSIGLSNVNNRIKLLFGENYGLSIDTKVNEGTSIKITFPAMNRKEMMQYVGRSNSRR